MIYSILQTIQKKDGFLHWLIQRSSAFVLLFSIFFLDFFTVFVLFVVAASIHLFTGVTTLLDDYVHGSVEHLLGVTLLRVCIIFVLKTIFIIFI